MNGDPRAAAQALASCARPVLIGVRHHSPACAAAMDALLDRAAPERLLLELPPELGGWLAWLGHPALQAPVALSCVSDAGEQLSFYPFADFSPELAAVRWAWRHGVPVEPFDRPIAERFADGSDPEMETLEGTPGLLEAMYARTGVDDGEELWDRLVEARAEGATPEAIRVAGLAVGWALRHHAFHGVGVSLYDRRREACMRGVISEATRQGARVAAVVGAFHAPALLPEPLLYEPPPSAASEAAAEGAGRAAPRLVTALVPYAFSLLDSRSGYPAGIRDPMLQQAVFTALSGASEVDAELSVAVARICRELRRMGHVASSPDAQEVVRIARDLSRLRGLPAPGRRELIEGLEHALGQGERLGRGRQLARAAQNVLVGDRRGRLPPDTPRSGLLPHVVDQLERLRLPGPGAASDEAKEMRLDPLRSELDRARYILLRRLEIAAIPYGERVATAGETLTVRYRLTWTPSTEALVELAGTRGVTLEQAAAGALRARSWRLRDDDQLVLAERLRGLSDAAEAGLVELAVAWAEELAEPLLSEGRLVDLVQALQLLQRIGRGHVPGLTTEAGTRVVGAVDRLAVVGAGVAAAGGLVGSDDPADVRALLDLVLVFVRAEGEDAVPGDGRLAATLQTMADGGAPLMQGAAEAALVMLRRREATELGTRLASWVDAGADREARHRMAKRLAGVLCMAQDLTEADPTILGPLVQRIEAMSDEAFLARVAALRAGFSELPEGGRQRLLDTLGERFDDDPRRRGPALELDDDPARLAAWAAADAEGRAAVAALRPALEAATDVRLEPEARGGGDPPVVQDHAIGARDRWRLILGRERRNMRPQAARVAAALDELYGGHEHGRDGSGGGQEDAFPTARAWADELEALFGAEVREEVIGRAAEAGWSGALLELDTERVQPSIELLEQVLSLKGGLGEGQLARMRRLVARVVDELVKELAVRLRPALTGLSTPRPTRRRGGPLDLRRTVQANLRTARPRGDGAVDIVADRLVFRTRARRSLDWRIVLLVDVSGSMEPSVIYSAMMAAILQGMPALSVSFLAFNTEVVDLSDRVDDPLGLLLDVQIGGGTHISKAVRYARELLAVPSRTIVLVVSDFEEGWPASTLVGEVRALVETGAIALGIAALDDRGAPRYCRAVAELLVGAGMPVAALTPLELARWIGDQIR